jgi:uncharacterized caspase-like protein
MTSTTIRRSVCRRGLWLGLLAIALFAATQIAFQGPLHAAVQERRVALVIGNAAYPVAPLRNPVNDARALGQQLRDLGFEVTQRENLTFREMLDAMQAFALSSRHGDVRLFFYAGHGVQMKGRNFLVPVDSGFGGDLPESLRYRSVDVGEFIQKLDQNHSGVNIVILDACRNAPVAAATGAGGVRTRGLALGSGLAPMVAPSGTLIAFSTSPNASAMDGASNANSPFTRHLLANIGTPGLAVEPLFKRVRLGVSQETGQSQIPWETSSLMGDFCFRPGPNNRCGG